MLFTLEMIEKMVKAEKTQTRRLVKKGDTLFSNEKEVLEEVKEFQHKTVHTEQYQHTRLDKIAWNGAHKEKCKLLYYEKLKKGVKGKNGKVKWQVGKDYAVQPGRGKAGVWWCSTCKTILKFEDKDDDYLYTECKCYFCCGNVHLYFPKKEIKKMMEDWPASYPNKWIPFRRRIIKIEEQKLLDITEEEAKKEGFKTMLHFLDYFYRIYGKKKGFTLYQKSYERKKLITILKELIDIKNWKYWNPDVWAITFEVVK